MPVAAARVCGSGVAGVAGGSRVQEFNNQQAQVQSSCTVRGFVSTSYLVALVG